MAFSKLKLGKDYFKSFSKIIGKDEEGRSFRECNTLLQDTHIILYIYLSIFTNLVIRGSTTR